MKSKNIHKDHRQRVRAKYFKEGVAPLDDKKIVEFLLFFGIPYKDTAKIADELIEKFGDLNGVLDAHAEELVKIDGIGENAAALVNLVHDIAVLYGDRCAEKAEDISVEPYLKKKYASERKEKVYLLSVDAAGHVKRCVKICDGSPDSAIVKTRMIVETVVHFESKNVVLAHNHPEGFAVPSKMDVTTTEELVTVLTAMGINLADHIIIAEDDSFSMAKSTKYGHLFR